MKRAQPKVVNAPLFQRNKLLHNINYLSSIKNTFYGGAVNHNVFLKYSKARNMS